MVVKEHLVQFQGELADELQKGKDWGVVKTKVVDVVEEEMKQTLADEIQGLKDMEGRTMSFFMEKSRTVTYEIMHGGTTRSQNEMKLRRYLEVEVPKMYEGLKEEAQ